MDVSSVFGRAREILGSGEVAELLGEHPDIVRYSHLQGYSPVTSLAILVAIREMALGRVPVAQRLWSEAHDALAARLGGEGFVRYTDEESSVAVVMRWEQRPGRRMEEIIKLMDDARGGFGGEA